MQGVAMRESQEAGIMQDTDVMLSEAELAKQRHIQESASIARTAGGAVIKNIIEVSDLDDTSWQNLGNCMGVDPDLFFPERGASAKEAKAVCNSCVVREDCLEYALSNGEKFGIWGGMSERERGRFRKQRTAATRAASEQ